MWTVAAVLLLFSGNCSVIVKWTINDVIFVDFYKLHALLRLFFIFIYTISDPDFFNIVAIVLPLNV